MANEIIRLDNPDSNRVRIMFHFPISQPIVIGGSSPAVTPSEGLGEPHLSMLAASALAGRIGEYDGGTAQFKVVEFNLRGQTPAQALADIRARYNAMVTELTNEYNARFDGYGDAFNSV